MRQLLDIEVDRGIALAIVAVVLTSPSSAARISAVFPTPSSHEAGDAAEESNSEDRKVAIGGGSLNSGVDER
eukprot:CAMPEP_0202775486 /NCGR_PEP_ID=MMETSP1388-20130828/48567_1 /ASSEMBLY_ACC=CAM_ASM_000864 /TAXON_ID=37098 /ORGANISM="Isochrysis sp, Strain CCMP1244" /LENGTH=71 /DNA_ID=CAMNT_0049444599 /DNA_START=64 /DNA_END=276 /DNA_ORIENTATION=-